MSLKNKYVIVGVCGPWGKGEGTGARQAIADYDDDALVKPLAEASLAIVQAQTGDIDSAIAALPHLLEVPSGETVGNLRTNALWDPLRKDPRFQKLCELPNK